MATGEASYVDSEGTVHYDLTTKTGDRAEIDDALFFTQAAVGSSGTGLIQAFVRTQATGSEAGYNTSERPLAYDENSSPSFTKSILLNQVPVIEIDGVLYYEFRLDINQTNSTPLLSLNELKVYSSTSATYSGEIDDPSFTGPTTLVWNLDDQNIDGTDDTDNTVLLNYSLQAGSGKSDMFFYVPVSDFAGADPDETWVVLYSEFGNTGVLSAEDGGDIDPLLYGDYSTNDGFEEWSVSKQLEGPLISGFKFHDENGNGVWDAGEDGLGGWKIDYVLTYKDGNGKNAPIVTVEGSTTTSDGTVDVDGDGDIDPAGYYVISVPLGAANNTQYTLILTEVLTGGWSNSFDGDATPNLTTTIIFSENDLTDADPTDISGDFGLTEQMNFGNFELFDISGTKYTDANGDGLTAGDNGLGGVTIFIDFNGNSLNDDEAANMTVTADDGSWSFTGLDHTYAGKQVFEVLPSGYVQTLGALGYTITGTSGTNQTGLDFANFELFDISGTKYTDANGDGSTAGDSGLGGVTIFIDFNGNSLNDDGAANMTVTADDGSWSFTDLDHTYAGMNVFEVLPSGYVQTLGALGYTITGTSGTNQTGLDFANFELFDISGTKYTDVTGDGITADDTGLGGVTIFIDADGDDVLDPGEKWTTTAANGNWSITDLDHSYADMEVKEITPSGYVQTVGQIGTVTDTEYLITGTSGTNQTGLDFANFELFDISGTKYTDANGDGSTAGDNGLGGVTIFIDFNGNSLNDDGAVNMTVTADDGSWSFTDLDHTYAGMNVFEVLPSGYVQTLGTLGYAITGTSGTDQTGLDFANFELFDISGTKYNDFDGDGVIDAGEPGLAGWTVFIDADNDGNLDAGEKSAVTGAGGTWSITGLDATYNNMAVKEVNQAGWVQTLGPVSTIVATSGNDQTGFDFANTELAPDIELNKLVFDPNSGEFVDGPVNFPSGSDIIYRYVLTNPGSTPLTGITLTDDNATLGDTSDDLNWGVDGIDELVRIDDGDGDALDVLDPGESWVFEYTKLDVPGGGGGGGGGLPVSTDLMDNFLLIGTTSNNIAKAVSVQNGDLGADVIVLSTEINDNVDFDLDDVFLNNAGALWTDVDNLPNTLPDFLEGAAALHEGVTWTGDVALTSPNGKYDFSNVELYGQVGVVADSSDPSSSVSNSLFFGDGIGDGVNPAGGLAMPASGVTVDADMAALRAELDAFEDFVTELPSEFTLKFGTGLPDATGIENEPIYYLNIDAYDTNNDGIAVIDIKVNGDFKITNSNWIIDGDGSTTAIFRIIGGSNLVLNQSTIMLGDGGIAENGLGAIFVKAAEFRNASDTGYLKGEGNTGDAVFSFNDVVLNGVGFYDLIVFDENIGNANFDNGTTEIKVNDGQGCTQFIGAKLNFNNVRFELCEFPEQPNVLTNTAEATGTAFGVTVFDDDSVTVSVGGGGDQQQALALAASDWFFG